MTSTQSASAQAPPAEIDREHKVQMELLQALEAAVGGAGGCVGVDEILDQYVAYSELHFMSEQLLMRLYAYPDYDDHVRDHNVLTERMQQMRELRAAGDDPALIAAVADQREQLVGHLKSRDRAFDRFLREQSGEA